MKTVSSEKITFFTIFTTKSSEDSITISKTNRKRLLKWCRPYKNLTVNQNLKSVIFSDETQVVLGTVTAYMFGGKQLKSGDRSVWDCIPYEMADLGSRFNSGAVFVIRESGHLHQLLVI